MELLLQIADAILKYSVAIAFGYAIIHMVNDKFSREDERKSNNRTD